jgi:hypothetical protein
MLLPPCVAEGELDAGIHAGVAVSKGCAGDVDSVSAEVDGAAGAEEVVNTDAALRGEVPDAGVSVGTVVLFIVGRPAECRIFVVCPEKTTGGLTPERKPLSSDHVPAKDDGGNGYSGKSSAYGVERRAYGGSSGRVRAEGPLKLWRVGLPEGERFDGVLEVAAKGAVTYVASEDLAGVNTGHEEFEVIAVFGDAETTLYEGADLERLMASGVMKRRGVVADGGLSGGIAGKRQQEGKGADGGCSDTSRTFGH